MPTYQGKAKMPPQSWREINELDSLTGLLGARDERIRRKEQLRDALSWNRWGLADQFYGEGIGSCKNFLYPVRLKAATTTRPSDHRGARSGGIVDGDAEQNDPQHAQSCDAAARVDDGVAEQKDCRNYEDGGNYGITRYS